MWEYVFNSMLWSTLGFLGGMYAGRMKRDVSAIKEATVDPIDDRPEVDKDQFGSGGVGGPGGQGGYGGPGGTGGVGGVGGTGGTGGSSQSDKENSVSPKTERTFGIVLIVLSLMTVGQAVYFTIETRGQAEVDRRRTSCQAGYNQAFTRALTARATISDGDRKNLNDMITAVVTLQTPAERRAAIETYVRVQADNDRKRAQNPLPEIPEGNCEE